MPIFKVIGITVFLLVWDSAVFHVTGPLIITACILSFNLIQTFFFATTFSYENIPESIVMDKAQVKLREK